MFRRNFIWLFMFLLLVGGCEFGSNEDSPEATETVVVVPVPGPTENPVIDPDQQQTDAQRPAGPDSHEDAKDETPPGVTPAEVAEINHSDPAGVGEPQPVGGAQLLSCKWNPVQNFSDRAAASVVSMTVVHFTVSEPGTLDAIRNLFNTPSFGASSHILLEPAGRCEQIVSYGKKAWTEGAFNSVSDSVEIICCRTTPTKEWWKSQPIIKNMLLASWIVDRARARGLPPRLVNPVECTPQAGWTDHFRLECGNTHTDVEPNFPYNFVAKQVQTLFHAGQVRAVWQVLAGGDILKQKTEYQDISQWLKDHPGQVRSAERENGRVVVRQVSVPR